MRVAIHQPHYMPWLGYLRKIKEVDIFVYLDNVNYVRHRFQNRNRILLNGKEHWLTIPVRTNQNKPIKDVKVNWDNTWNLKQYRTLLHGYKEQIKDKKEIIEEFFLHDDELLVDWCVRSIDLLCDVFGIKVEKVFESSLKIDATGTERLVNICKALKADAYLTGFEHKDYIKEEMFGDIKFEYMDWIPESQLSALHFYLMDEIEALGKDN